MFFEIPIQFSLINMKLSQFQKLSDLFIFLRRELVLAVEWGFIAEEQEGMQSWLLLLALVALPAHRSFLVAGA